MKELLKEQARIDDIVLSDTDITQKEAILDRILSAQVQLGEIANTWRGYKFWSDDRKPRTAIKCAHCKGYGRYPNIATECRLCDGVGWNNQNQLLDKCADTLHSILSIGNLMGYQDEHKLNYIVEHDTKHILNIMFGLVSQLDRDIRINNTLDDISLTYSQLYSYYVALVTVNLEYDWDDIVTYYHRKNKLNAIKYK